MVVHHFNPIPLTYVLMSLEKTFSLGDIAKLLGAELKGDAATIIRAIKPLELAQPGELSFFAPTSKRKHAELFELAKRSKASALIVDQAYPELPAALVIVPNPLLAVMGLASQFRLPNYTSGIHETASIHTTAHVAEGVSIGAYCVVGEHAEIGSGTVLHPHVVVYPRAKIGQKSVIHSGAVIREDVVVGTDCVVQNGVVVGGEGFGYAPNPGKGHHRIPHLGTVILEDGVDLGANSTVDRATLGETRIRRQAKVDNLVMIAHNVDVGERTLLCGQVGISGSSKIGSDVILAGQVGVADHITIGSRVRAAAKTGIGSDIPDTCDVAGYPHMEVRAWRRVQAILRNLPRLLKGIRRTGDTDEL